MKPKRGETADQTIDRWAKELLFNTLHKTPYDCLDHEFDKAIETVQWLEKRLRSFKAMAPRSARI